MVRWHEDSCRNPDVVVEDGHPRCRACHRSPNLDILIEAQRPTTSTLPLPPDEPPGKLNLFWPGSVPYVSTSPPAPVPEGANAQRDSDHHEDAPAPTPTYPSRLRQNEFRLLYLSEPKHDALVHAEFGVHDMTRYPEYETTSYAWGGEDGDSTLCKPLFLGPYWDVLFQTRNCWSMLHLMRPSKGLRTIWVDAVCINQNDTKERDDQVSKMAQIYSRCRRVYIYLGPDLAPPTATQHPLRRPLEKHAGIDLAQLLQRRYFSRLWVIQELILSPEAAFQVGDTEFWMNSSTMYTLSRSSSFRRLDHTAALWFQHLGTGKFGHKDLCQVLRAVSRSECQDPRDRVFAICSMQRELQPNYALSCQHVFIGVFAHILLDLRYADLLLYASGQAASGRYPSWVPDWTISSPGWVFQENIATVQDVAIYKSSAALAIKNTRLFILLTKERFRTINEKSAKITLSGSRPSPYIGLITRPDIESFCAYDLDQSERQWDHNATIDASTGTLSINLVHLLALQSRPTKVLNTDRLDLFAVESGKGVLFLSSNAPLSAIVEPFQDHIFLLENQEEAWFYLILRQIQHSDTYRIIAHGREIAFRVHITPFRPAQEEELHLHVEKTDEGPFATLPLVPFTQLRALSLVDLHHNLLRSLCRFPTKCAEANIDGRICHKLLLGYVPRVDRDKRAPASYRWDIEVKKKKATWEPAALKAIQGVLNESRSSTPGFLVSFIGCLHESLEPRVQGNFVCIALKDDEATFRECMRDGIWETMDNTAAIRNPRGRQDRAVRRLRASKDTLINWIERTETFLRMSELTPAVQLTHESEIEMAQRRAEGPTPPRPEDERIEWSRWPKVIMDEFSIDGKTVRVNIA